MWARIAVLAREILNAAMTGEHFNFLEEDKLNQSKMGQQGDTTLAKKGSQGNAVKLRALQVVTDITQAGDKTATATKKKLIWAVSDASPPP